MASDSLSWQPFYCMTTCDTCSSEFQVPRQQLHGTVSTLISDDGQWWLDRSVHTHWVCSECHHLAAKLAPWLEPQVPKRWLPNLEPQADSEADLEGLPMSSSTALIHKVKIMAVQYCPTSNNNQQLGVLSFDDTVPLECRIFVRWACETSLSSATGGTPAQAKLGELRELAVHLPNPEQDGHGGAQCSANVKVPFLWPSTPGTSWVMCKDKQLIGRLSNRLRMEKMFAIPVDTP